MSATQPILESIHDRLEAQLPSFTVELFPDNVDDYFLKDELGAVLVQYAGSKFETVGSSDIIQQRRVVAVALTILARSQHDDSGALAMLDQVRLAVVGFRPTNCEAISLLSEEFAGEASGIWQYQLLLRTETWQVENRICEDKPGLIHVHARRPHDPLNPDLKAKHNP
ncbi:hypothetical protein HPC38_07625 [Pasteurellaceae bacterium HPA106]|uniref:Gp37 family protein n=1 Tax=Spirabiliibacterium pneumoniae TaxID=221400 RepID=UPI001AAD8ABC|nr:Gp37 family protein [Spirabiliibacterium pneumoniae]MBE2896741.1 hypothetical protein [Spirabiliibacterium pneumoniae]